jgi:polyvinyl alcohol dehydrogenase (cytochrome)
VEGSSVGVRGRSLVRACAIFVFVLALLLVLAAAGKAAAGARGPSDPWLGGPRQPHARLSAPITAANASTLHAAWRIPTREPVSSAPILAHGRVYFTDWADTAYVADAATGHVIWKRTLGRPNERWPWHGLAGTGALVGSTWYVASVEGTLYALDARTGAVRWKERVTHQRFAGVLADLQYTHGVLYIGLDSVAEPMASVLGPGFKPTFKGQVLAVEAGTGRVIWRTQLVHRPANGVAVWGGVAVDDGLHRLYVATGNNYSGASSGLSDSMVCLDTRTGRVVWVDQTFKHDVWLPTHPKGPDWDYGAAPQLFTVHRGGHRVPAVGAGNKAGLYVVFDRRTGRPLWHVEVGSTAGEGIRWDGSLGRGVLFIASNLSFPDMNAARYPVRIRALDMDSGRSLWVRRRVQAGMGADSSFLAGDVLFVGDETGGIGAYDANTGATVAHVRAAGPVSSSLNSAGRFVYAGTGIPVIDGGTPGGDGLQAFAIAP